MAGAAWRIIQNDHLMWLTRSRAHCLVLLSHTHCCCCVSTSRRLPCGGAGWGNDPCTRLGCCYCCYCCSCCAALAAAPAPAPTCGTSTCTSPTPPACSWPACHPW